GEEVTKRDEEDESLDANDERERLDDEGHGLDDEDHGLGGKGLALEEEEEGEAIPEGQQQTPPSPDWSSGSLPISPSSSLVPSPIALRVATPIAMISVNEDQFLERYRFKHLERKQERIVMTFGALWRPVLALEAWAGRVDTRLANMSRDRYDDHRLIHDMLMQQAAMQHELQEMRGRVTALEQEMDHRE
ncbi:hypothetical protein Tco_1453359, partial [Tanacetum coccineum]